MSTHASTITRVIHDDREPDRRPLDFGLIRRAFGYMRPFAGKRNLLLVIVLLRAIELPALAWVIGAVLGGPVAKMDVTGVVLGALGYAVLAAVAQLTLRYRVLLALQLGEQAVHDIRNDMFGHLQKMTMRFHHKTKLGRIISRFTSDADVVRSGVQDVLFSSIVVGGQMIVAAIFMVWYDAVLFLVILGMAPILWAINVHYRRRLSEVYRAVQESYSRITGTLAESVNGIEVTQGFARQDLNSRLFHDLVADHSRYNLDAARVSGVFLPLIELNSQLFVALILIIGGWRVLNGQADVASLYQFILMTGMFFGPIQNLGNQYNQAMTAMAGAERVFKFLDTTPEWTDPPGAFAPDRIAGRIELKHVTFAYEPGRPVLRDVSLTADPGQTVAIIGHTGSGKSTIINLISRFYLPTDGEVLIDGHDIRSFDDKSLHRRMGVVLQQNFLFTGTVMDNIRIGRPGASDAEIIAAAEKLDCRDLIEALPDGFKTVFGEGGAGISLGQRQLVCFARAMLADPSILILDEATSSVDTLTEARIQKALNILFQNRTSIVVAHRLSTVRHADVVLAMQDGRIMERGTHEELIRARGVYADLYRDFVRTSEA